jgi:hypothetical protein
MLAAQIAQADPRATVWSRHPDAIRPFFPAETYRMLDAQDEKLEMDSTGYMLPQKRDALFHKLQLEQAVQGLDEMDKDMLVMGARFEEYPQLRKNYPTLSEQQIKNLMREVKEIAER